MATNKNKNQTAKGALATDPKFQLATGGVDALRAQRSELNRIAAKGGSAGQRAQQQLELVRNAILKANKEAAAPTPAPTPTTQEEGYNQVVDNSNQATNEIFNQIDEQGAFNPSALGVPQVQQFNPGDYQQQYQKSYDTVMNQFNRTLQPQFQKQQQDFNQYAAERGWDPNSEVAKELFKQRVADPQSNAVQGAMESAHQGGLAAQGQAYGQASNTFGQNLAGQSQQYNQAYSQYQMPYQNLGAMAPYFGAQASMGLQNNQQGFVAGQNQLDRQQQDQMTRQQFEYQKYLQANAPRGGGGGGGNTFDQQIALQNNGFYNQMALAAASMGQGNPVNPMNNAVAGFGAGFGTGLGAGLAK